MSGRIAMNPPDVSKEYGPIDEIVVTGCDVHLEQMSQNSFVMVVKRGKDELRVTIYAPGRGKVHAYCEVDNGFADLGRV